MAKTDVLLCIMAILAVVTAVYMHNAQAGVEDTGLPEYHRVTSGESYWSIARHYWPGQHTGERVHELRQLNATLPGSLQPGDVVYLREVE